MPITGVDITTDFVNELAHTADELELDYGDPVGETLRLLVRQRDHMKAALEDIAKQKKTDELETEYDVEVADFETGYDTIIDVARKALNASS